MTGATSLDRGRCSDRPRAQFVAIANHANRVGLASLKARRILGGLNLQEYYPELTSSILVCATETKTPADLDHYVDQLSKALPSVHEKAHSY